MDIIYLYSFFILEEKLNIFYKRLMSSSKISNLGYYYESINF